MEPTSYERKNEVDGSHDATARLIDQDQYGSSQLGWWFYVIPRPDGQLCQIRISREGDLDGKLPSSLEARISLALQNFKATTQAGTEWLSRLQFLISSMCWAGIEVEISPSSKRAFPYLQDFYAPLFNSLLDAIGEVFEDKEFASQVFSLCPAVGVVE